MSKFCTNCGSQVGDNAMFCTVCGAKLGPAQNNPQNVQQNVNGGNDFNSQPVNDIPENTMQTSGSTTGNAQFSNTYQPDMGAQQNIENTADNTNTNGTVYGNAAPVNVGGSNYGAYQPNQGMGVPPASGSMYGNAQPSYTKPANGMMGNGMDGMTNNGGATANGSKKTLFIVLGALVALIAIVVICFFVFFRSTMTTPLDNLMKVINDGSGSALEKLMPSCMSEQMQDVGSALGMDLDEYYEETAEELHQDFLDEYGKKFKVSYEIREQRAMKLSEMESYVSSFEILSPDDVKIDEGYRLEVDFVIEYADGKETETETIYVGKVNGDWCILNYQSVL